MPTYPPTSEPISVSTPVTASLVAPIPVPTHGAGGTFTVLAITHIAAPPAVVLRAILNTNSWPRWNSFCPHCVISPPPPPSAPSAPPPPTVDAVLETKREGWLELHASATLSVFMNGDGLASKIGPNPSPKPRSQGITITRLERLGDGRDGYRIAWTSLGFRTWQLRSERVMEFVATETGTRYVCWETFGGLLAGVVSLVVGTKLVQRFGDYAGDLKGFVEGAGWGEEGEAEGDGDGRVLDGIV